MKTKDKQKISTLIWLAIITAVVPFLAIPAWLTKLLVAAFALSIAVLGYLVAGREGYDYSSSRSWSEKPSPDTQSSRQQEHSEKSSPVDITDPQAGRFIASNTYERRRENLGN